MLVSPAAAERQAEKACRAFFKGHLGLRPLEATHLGLRGLDGRLEDLSPAGVRRQIRFYQGSLRRLGKLRRKVRPPFSLDLAHLERLARFCLHLLRERPEHPGSLELILDLYETLCVQELRAESRADWAALASRLEGLPRFVGQVRANFDRDRLRHTPDRRQVQDTLEALQDISRGLGRQLPSQARRKAPDLSRRFLATGRRAEKALQELSLHLRKEVLPSCREAFPIGRREYAWRLRNGLGVEASLPQVETRGRRLLMDIHRRMRGVALRVDGRARGERGLRRLMDRLSSSCPKSDREMFSLYRRLTDRARDFVARRRLFDLSPDYRLRIIPTPAGLGSAITTAAYFSAPPLDPSKKGYFLVTPSHGETGQLRAHNRYHAASTAVHEAFPGHDMQYFQWQQAGGRIHPWRFLHGEPRDWSTSMNIEGYAHYAEELMRRHGFFTPREELFQLAAQAWRAARIVVDIGLHARRMSFGEAARFLRRKAFLDARTARGEAFRYTKWPTQALTYALGKLEIEALKKDCRRAWDPGFSEARFHQAFLAFGPLPPGLIRRALFS